MTGQEIRQETKESLNKQLALLAKASQKCKPCDLARLSAARVASSSPTITAATCPFSTQGGERGGTLAGEAQTVYRRSFPCWYKQTPEAALSEGLGAAATNKHAPGIYRRIACRYILFA